MKLKAEIEGQLLDVDIQRATSRVTAKINERSYDLEVSEPETGVYLLKIDGAVYEVVVSTSENGSVTIDLRDRHYEISIVDPKRSRGSASGQSQDHGLADIKSAMPGKVVRLLVSLGNSVEKGDGVIVVEAMKMQNEIKSPKSGVVKSISVSEGSTVNAGEVLLVIE